MNKIHYPLIYLAYLLLLIYFSIFSFQIPLLFLLVFSLIFPIKKRQYLVLLILTCFSAYFFWVKKVAAFEKAHQPTQISQISPMIDSLQLNGNQLSFQASSDHHKFQVYYLLKTEAEKNYFQKLDKNCELTVEASLSVPETQRNFNGFDNQKFLAKKGIYRQIKIEKIIHIRENERLNLSRLRRQAIVHIQTHFSPRVATYMTGLLLGYLPKEFSEISRMLSSLGIIHLFALSGMHVNFFVDKIRKILLRCGLTQETVKIMLLPLCFFYGAMAGFSVSVIRALIQKNLSFKTLDNLAMALMIVMFLMPLSLLTVGGQLTFFYAFALAMLQGKFVGKNKIINSLDTGSILSVLTLPLLVVQFHVFQPLSILLTFVFGMCFELLILPLLFIAFALSFLGIFLPIDFIFQGFEKILAVLDGLFHYPMVFGTIQNWQFLLLLICIGLLVDFWRQKMKRRLLILVISILFISGKYPLFPSITMIDVGQGDSILLQDSFNRHTILIDTGGKVTFEQPDKWQQPSQKSNAENTLIPYLQAAGIGKIDQLILTHTDDDHVGDFVKLADKIKIKEVCVSEGELSNPSFIKKLKQANNIKVRLLKMGDQLPIFDGHLQILSAGFTKKGDNNDSVITYGNFFGSRFLFTGDLEKEGESELLKAYPHLKVDVLKVGHHGSKSSSSVDFIQKIQPKLALISVGKNNRYKHPNQETLATLDRQRVEILRTDENGSIKLIKKLKKWKILTVK